MEVEYNIWRELTGVEELSQQLDSHWRRDYPL